MIVSTTNGCMPPIYPKIRGKPECIRYPCYVEWKLDGELNMFKSTYLVSKSGKTRHSCPITEHLARTIPQDRNITLYGELHYGEGKFGDLYKLLSNAKDNCLNYGIFDVTAVDLDRNATYEDRREYLLNIIKLNTQVYVVPTIYCENHNERVQAYDLAIHDGYEGVVVKNKDSRLVMGNNTQWVKMKATYSERVLVVQIDPTRERIEFTHHNKTHACKVPNRHKQSLKTGDWIEIEHQGMLNGHGLRHPVFKRKVV